MSLLYFCRDVVQNWRCAGKCIEWHCSYKCVPLDYKKHNALR